MPIKQMKWQAWARECVCVCVRVSVRILLPYIFSTWYIYSQEGFYVLIFSLKNSNRIMKYSSK